MRTGRPRSAAADAAIFDAAIALIREVGYDDLTMDGIARRAGVSKATIYRRWTGKEVLVAEALERIVSRVGVPDTGDMNLPLLNEEEMEPETRKVSKNVSKILSDAPKSRSSSRAAWWARTIYASYP